MIPDVMRLKFRPCAWFDSVEFLVGNFSAPSGEGLTATAAAATIMTKAIWLAAILSAGMAVGGTAKAAILAPFTPAAFAAAQSAGQPIVIEVYAPWCPICARQQPIIKQLEGDAKYSKVTVLRVDFDSQGAVLRSLHVAMQSTLIGYQGKTETGRLVGVVRKDPIDQLFASTLKG